MILADIRLGYLVSLELIDDLIVAGMFKASVIDYQIVEEHYFPRRIATFQFLFVYLWYL